MLLSRYPVGDFTTLPLSATTAEMATYLYGSMSADDWSLLSLVTTDLDAMATRIAATLNVHRATVLDALHELSQVALFGWPGYVEPFLYAARRRHAWTSCTLMTSALIAILLASCTISA